jgi:hypothetical protein
VHVATSTSPWSVELRNSYDTISNMGWFSESDLAVLTNTLNHGMSYYINPDVTSTYSCSSKIYMTLYINSLLCRIRAFPSEGRATWVRRLCNLARVHA